MQQKDYNRWLVVTGALICQFVIGALYTWSVFRNPIQQATGWSATDVSLAFTINLASIPFWMIFAGRLLPKMGPTKLAIVGASVLAVGLLISSQTQNIGSLWALYLGYGVLAGAGIGIVYGIPIATCLKWFPDKRGFITGLAVMGFGIGSVAFAPVASFLVGELGPFKTFFYQAIYSIVGVGLGAQLMRVAPDGYKPKGWTPPAPKPGQQSVPAVRPDFTAGQMLQTPQYWMILVLYAFANVAGLMIIAHASPIGQQLAEMTAVQAAGAVGILNIFNSLGRLFWGTVSDKLGRMNTVAVMYIISAAVMFSMGSISSMVPYVIAVSLIAFCFGGAMGTFPSLTADFFGAKNLSVNYGLIFIAYSLGAIIGPIMATTVLARTGGSYNAAFVISGTLCAIGVVMAFITKPPKAPKTA